MKALAVVPANANEESSSRELLERQAFEAFKAFVLAFQRLVSDGASPPVEPQATSDESWMGHKRIDETMIYVHVAETHRREIPEPVLEAGNAERDPDRRILAMLSARGANVPDRNIPEHQ